mgnify:CR=1 FL=1
MSNFRCKECGAVIYDEGKKGYTTGCEHYPIKQEINEQNAGSFPDIFHDLFGEGLGNMQKGKNPFGDKRR